MSGGSHRRLRRRRREASHHGHRTCSGLAARVALDDAHVGQLQAGTLINEAFATQVLGCLKLLDVDESDSRVNPNGGAIAVGHPLGASGARLALTAARQLQRTGERYALVSLCIGVGQGLSLILERV